MYVPKPRFLRSKQKMQVVYNTEICFFCLASETPQSLLSFLSSSFFACPFAPTWHVKWTENCIKMLPFCISSVCTAAGLMLMSCHWWWECLPLVLTLKLSITPDRHRQDCW